MAVAVEVLTGLVLGFTAQFIFWAVQFAGEIAGFQMGLSLAQVYDPATGGASNPLGNLLTLSFLLVFLLLDGPSPDRARPGGFVRGGAAGGRAAGGERSRCCSTAWVPCLSRRSAWPRPSW